MSLFPIPTLRFFSLATSQHLIFTAPKVKGITAYFEPALLLLAAGLSGQAPLTLSPSAASSLLRLPPLSFSLALRKVSYPVWGALLWTKSGSSLPLFIKVEGN